jgi:hypothetical protein
MPLYRGVHADHPALQECQRGIVRPADVNGGVSPEQHNEGGFSAMSPFTSWTHDRGRAVWYANRRGAGGLLLRVPEGNPGPNEDWIWVWSPDVWEEDEVLLRGVRMGVEVIEE